MDYSREIEKASFSYSLQKGISHGLLLLKYSLILHLKQKTKVATIYRHILGIKQMYVSL